MRISIFEYNNYVGYLSQQLKFKMKQNPNYSLRAFARDLNLSPSLLCQILNNKKTLSCKQAYAIAHRLLLNPEETFYLLDLSIIENSPDRKSKQEAINRRDYKKDQYQRMKDKSDEERFGHLVRAKIFDSVDQVPKYYFLD